MNSVYHAKSAARRWGGSWRDYIGVEELIDSSKQHIGDHRHRALFHNAYGVWLCQRVFGEVISVERGDVVIEVPTRRVAERHIIEDLGWLPSVADYFKHMELATWMSGAKLREEPLSHLRLASPEEKKSGERAWMMPDSATHRSFLGITITGDVIGREKRARQRPLEELAPLMQALIDDDGIAWFSWQQWTPYFNDGDPCEFSVHSELAVCLDDVDDDDYWDAGVTGNKHLGSRPRQWTGAGYRDGAYAGPDEARYDRCLSLEKALESGSFDHVLLEHFGDHAAVRVSRDGIFIEHYQHE